MKTNDLMDDSGRLVGLEVKWGFFFGRRRAVGLVRGIPGIKVVGLSYREDEFCEFEMGGLRFKMWEPFGDNDRFLINAEPPVWCEQIETIKAAFAK